ncbi:hypothetical protein OROMI_004273 [Orobanche minor]
MAHYAGILGRLRMASRSDRAPTAAAHPPPEKKRRDAPGPSSKRRSLKDEVPPLARDKKRKLVEAASKPAGEVPLPPIVERPTKEKAVIAKMTPPRGEPRRGRAYFGRDLEKYARAREEDPNRPALVVDFLSSRSPQHESDVPNHLARAVESLPKAWTSELESLARRGLADSVQATIALALQTAMMATKVASDYERRPFVSSLQADLQLPGRR